MVKMAIGGHITLGGKPFTGDGKIRAFVFDCDLDEYNRLALLRKEARRQMMFWRELSRIIRQYRLTPVEGLTLDIAQATMRENEIQFENCSKVIEDFVESHERLQETTFVEFKKGKFPQIKVEMDIEDVDQLEVSFDVMVDDKDHFVPDVLKLKDVNTNGLSIQLRSL